MRPPMSATGSRSPQVPTGRSRGWPPRSAGRNSPATRPYRDNGSRIANSVALDEIIAGWIRERPTEEALRVFRRLRRRRGKDLHDPGHLLPMFTTVPARTSSRCRITTFGPLKNGPESSRGSRAAPGGSDGRAATSVSITPRSSRGMPRADGRAVGRRAGRRGSSDGGAGRRLLWLEQIRKAASPRSWSGICGRPRRPAWTARA